MTYHLPLPPSWDHTAYLLRARLLDGTPVHRIIQIESATHGTDPLDHTVTTRDAELFGLSDWPTAEAARQAAIDAGYIIAHRADLFEHITYLRRRATQIHAALATVAEKAPARPFTQGYWDLSSPDSSSPRLPLTASPRLATPRAAPPTPHSPPPLPEWPLRTPRGCPFDEIHPTAPADIRFDHITETAPYTHPRR